MSANNYRVCPRCTALSIANRDEKIAAVFKRYGKVPPEEYERLLSEARADVPLGSTLREDWAIGLYGDGFMVSYRAFCSVCGLKYEFQHKEPVLQGDSP